MTYAIVKTGGKQYRVQEGQSLLVERLPAGEGAKVALEPLLYRGDTDVEMDDLERVKVEAKVVRHERGPKLRVLKFKPKKRVKKRTGHRQELTRIEVTGIKLQERRRSAAAAAKTEEEGTEDGA
jgi:large subunit ribosomal protein L21